MKLSIRRPLRPHAEFILGVAGVGVFIAVWCFLTYGGVVREIFLPTPTKMWKGLLEYDRNGWLWLSIWRSFTRVSKALGLVILVGVPIGVFMGSFRPVDAFLQKIVNGAKSVPTTALTGVVVLWFGLYEFGKIVFLFLGAIFFMIILVRNAVAGVPDDYVLVALDLGANRLQLITRVLLPSALPQIWDAIVVCNGIMWTYIVLAEFLGSNQEEMGLGYLLQLGSRTQNPGKVFATLVVIALISATTDHALHAFRRRFLKW